RADFAANPFGAPAGTAYLKSIPSFAAVQAGTCNATGNAPGCFRPALNSQLISPNAQVPYSWQGSLGIERQFGSSVGVNADYVYEGQRDNIFNVSNENVSFNAAGLPVNYLTNPSINPYPSFGQVARSYTSLASNYNALQTALTKRLSHHWEASATYTLGFLKDSDPCPTTAPANVSKGYCGEYGYATTDQRHRAVFNAIWQGPHDIELTGLYF